MVPEGWKARHLSDLASKVSDGIHSTPTYSTDSDIFFVNGNNLKNGTITINESTKKVCPENAEKHRRELTDRTLLMSINGTIGNLAYYKGENVVLGKSACYMNIAPETNIDYIFYSLADSRTQAFYTSELTGSTIKNLSLKTIKSTKILTPPLPEQQKIARILSTWDKAITNTEKRIDNSKQQKKALMQQLLTGKKRFPGFEGEWEEVKLGDIAKYQKGYTYKSTEYSEGETKNGFLTLKSILRGGGYSASGIKYLLSSVDEKFAVKAGDVVFAVTDLTRNAEVVGAPIFIPIFPFENTYISMDLVKLELNTSVNKQFIYYLLKLPCYRNFMRARASGSTVLHLDVQGSKKLKLLIPSTITEQQKIATVLTYADKEIELLEQQLADLKQEKKALMQQLLTGKRRVKVDEGEAA